MKCNIQVIEATDIPNQEETNLYVRLSATSINLQKETDIASNNPPHWDSEFSFQFQTDEDNTLEIALLNGDKLGIDKEIGNSSLSISELEKDTEIDKWIELKSDDGVDAGRVHLMIKVTEQKVKDLNDILNLLDDDELEVDVPEFDKAGLENKEFQPKHSDEPTKKIPDEISGFNIDDLVDGNDSGSDGELLLKAGIATFTVIDLKNAEQIPQIASNIGSSELYCTLSTSENKKSVKTKVITDPSSSAWNQTFKFRVNDVSSAKFKANLYSANKDTENEELATGEFSIDDITDKKNITVDLNSTQDPSVLVQLEISVEYSLTDELSEEESNSIDNLEHLLDDSQNIEDQNEADIVPEQNQPETHDELNEVDQKVEYQDIQADQNEASNENDHQGQVEPENIEQDQIEILNENEQQEEAEQNQIDAHVENEQEEKAITQDEGQYQISTHDEIEQQHIIDTHDEKEQQESELQNQIEVYNEEEQNQIEVHNEEEEQNQIEVHNEEEEQNQIEIHNEEEEQNQVEIHNEEEDQSPIVIAKEIHKEEEEQHEQIEIPNEENEYYDQIENQNEEEERENQPNTYNVEEQQDEIETYNDQQDQIETHDELEPRNEDEEEEQNYQPVEEDINSQTESKSQHSENIEEDVFEDYEEEQFYEGQGSNSQRPPTKDEKFERSINKLLKEKHSDQEEAEKEKEKIYNIVKSDALEMYQKYVITPVERKEDSSRSIVLKLTKNSEELEKLHERMSKPENMSPLKLKRELDKLEQEVKDLDDEISLISSENDELENVIFMMRQRINKATNE